MKRKYDILLTVIFCVFIGIMAAGIAFLPKQEVSVNEKRHLAPFPRLSVQSVLSGYWETGFEDYISDHFPQREAFTAIDSYYTLWTGQNGAKGVYKGRDGYLINTPVKCDENKLRANMEAILSLAEKTGVRTRLMAVPTAGHVMADKLPVNHISYPDESIRYDIEQMCGGSVEFIDIFKALLEEKDNAQLYYKTDHHWTSEGAYTAYRVWAQNEGIAVRKKQEYNIESYNGFYGTSYSKSALWSEKPDSIELWRYPVNAEVTIENNTYEDMFFTENLSSEDKYTVFLDGNHAFAELVNRDRQNDRRVLVIKDSYAHCLVPFMIENASRVDMVDTRYYTGSVSELAAKNKYDEILVVGGVSSFCETSDLSTLR